MTKIHIPAFWKTVALAPKKDVEQETKDDGENDDKGESSDDNDDRSSSSDDDNDSEDEKQDGKDEENEVESVGDSSSSDEEEESSEEKVEQSTIEKDEKPQEKPETPTEDDGKVPKDHEIWSVLDKLNSKQKRTLSRKLDRLGTAVLDEVEEEANKILDQTIPMETPVVVDPKRPAESVSSEQPTKKKRKKQADWSSLTPEERLRREDQRRKQQEAAERRARGEDIKPGHKRPLNSARRRANRRKPKWEKKAPTDRPAIGSYKQEHHSSGFMVRKNRKEHQQEQASW